MQVCRCLQLPANKPARPREQRPSHPNACARVSSAALKRRGEQEETTGPVMFTVIAKGTLAALLVGKLRHGAIYEHSCRGLHLAALSLLSDMLCRGLLPTAHTAHPFCLPPRLQRWQRSQLGRHVQPVRRFAQQGLHVLERHDVWVHAAREVQRGGPIVPADVERRAQ